MRVGKGAEMGWRTRASEDEAGRWNFGGPFLWIWKSARIKLITARN